jgi:ferric-chelate reductase (NADPH)
MASLKSLIRDTVGQLVFKELAIEDVRDVSPHFRRLRVSGQSLRTAQCSAGDKVQIMIPDAGPRTYTPFAHNLANGTLDLLAYVHGDAPAAKWSRTAQAGMRVRAFGPRGSLPLASLRGPVVFFGDETSFGAALSLREARGRADELAFVFESTQREESEQVLAELGLEQAVVVSKLSAHAHLSTIESHLRTALTRLPNANLVLTGHAQTIQAIRARLKAQPAGNVGQKVKAYWADGKQGLD